MSSPIEGEADLHGQKPVRFRPTGLILPGLALVAGVWLLSQVLGAEEGEALDEGLVFWTVMCFWLVAFISTGGIRGYREAKLREQAEASGGVLTEPASPLLWPATVLGIVWRGVLFLTPGLALGWFAVTGSTNYQETRCRDGYGQCISGAATWLPLAVILVLFGLVLLFFSARRSVREARRRLEGLPPEVPVTKGLAKATTAAYTVDRSAVAPVASPPPASTPAASAVDRRIDRLAELADLHEQGVIDDAELERLKAEVLAEDG